MGSAKYFSMLIFSIFILGVALAAPGIPHQFYGFVTINGAPANGALIVAKINNVEVSRTLSSNGNYGYNPNIFYVPDPNSNNAGKRIDFYLSGTLVANKYFESGTSTKLDFNLGIAPFCGDTSCNAGETCSTCATDCGVCPSTGGGGGGGGGGGAPVAQSINVQVTGNCLGKPIVLKATAGTTALGSATVSVKHNNNTSQTTTDANGGITFTFNELGKYEFTVTKNSYSPATKQVDVLNCTGETTNTGTGSGAGADLCSNKNCNDLNPCTDDSCALGVCNYAFKSDGTTCGTELTCQKGECVAKIVEPVNTATGAGAATGLFALGTDTAMPIVLVIVIIAIFAILLLLSRRKK